MSGVKLLVKVFLVGIIVLLGVSLYQLNKSTELKRNLKVSFVCVLPPHPANGWYRPTVQLKSAVPTGTILRFFCNETYMLDKGNTSICIDGHWFPTMGQCLRTCPSMYSTKMMKVRCSHNNRNVKSCENPVEDTRMQFYCPQFYEDNRKVRLSAICKEGRWSESPPSCIPICGRRPVNAITPLIVNGNVAKQRDFPWQVAIYKDKSYHCGGTLLHERLILTAAHCIEKDSISQYRVIVGNFYRNYSTARQEENAQSSSVHAVYHSEDYNGDITGAFNSDIAVIVPTKVFKMSISVHPICIDWNGEYEKDKTTGIVCGWGNTVEYGNHLSEELMWLETPIIRREQCKNMLDMDKKRYLTDDKICGGYLNESTSACLGDSGSGLIFNHMDRYYLMGVVSIAPKSRTSGGCDSQKYTFYTNVAKHLFFFIMGHYQQYKPSLPSVYNKPTEKSNGTTTVVPSTIATLSKPPHQTLNTNHCILPAYPKNGTWTIYGATKLVPGDSLATGLFLKITCNAGFKLDGDQIVTCENGTLSSKIGECLKVCSSLKNTTSMTVSCSYKMGTMENCFEPVHGSSAFYHCASFYEDMKNMEYPLYCKDGNWTPSDPECFPRCGYKIVKDPMSLNNNSSKGEFPWVVTISTKSKCMGTLLSDKVIVTSPECFNDTNKNYIITAGQDSSQTSGLIQSRNVTEHDISITKSFAFIVLQEPFQFSSRVQPVCLDGTNSTNNPDYGYITGWRYDPNSKRSSHETNTATVEFHSLETCRNMIPEAYGGPLEKSCFQFRSNDTLKYDGGGVFVEYNNQFYLAGIVGKIGRKYGKYTLYTPIHDHVDEFESKTA